MRQGCSACTSKLGPALQDRLQGRSWCSGAGRPLPHVCINAITTHAGHSAPQATPGGGMNSVCRRGDHPPGKVLAVEQDHPGPSWRGWCCAGIDQRWSTGVTLARRRGEHRPGGVPAAEWEHQDYHGASWAGWGLHGSYLWAAYRSAAAWVTILWLLWVCVPWRLPRYRAGWSLHSSCMHGIELCHATTSCFAQQNCCCHAYLRFR